MTDELLCSATRAAYHADGNLVELKYVLAIETTMISSLVMKQTSSSAPFRSSQRERDRPSLRLRLRHQGRPTL